MNGFRVSGPWDRPHHEHNARVVNSAVDAEFYTRTIMADGLYPIPTTGSDYTSVSGSQVLRMTNSGGNLQCGWQLLRPTGWLKGVIGLSLFYSFSASGQDVVLTFAAGLSEVGAGSLVGTGALSSQVTVPGSAAANRLEQYNLSTHISIDAGDDLIVGTITRNSADAADGTAVFRINALKLTYIPARQEI